MEDILLGIIAILVGGLFCFRGYLAMRVVIPIWGALSGFVLGAGLITSWTGDGFLSTTLSWIVGAAVALVFGLLAYLYYEVSVVIVMGAVGFILGATLLAALGVTWTWVVVLAGLAFGALLAILAIVGDLPMGILTILTAFAGSSAMVVGTMLLLNIVSTGDFDDTTVTERIADDWWWYLIYLGLAIAGMVAQFRSTASMRESLRDAWSESGGRHLASG